MLIASTQRMHTAELGRRHVPCKLTYKPRSGQCQVSEDACVLLELPASAVSATARFAASQYVRVDVGLGPVVLPPRLEAVVRANACPGAVAEEHEVVLPPVGNLVEAAHSVACRHCSHLPAGSICPGLLCYLEGTAQPALLPSGQYRQVTLHFRADEAVAPIRRSKCNVCVTGARQSLNGCPSLLEYNSSQQHTKLRLGSG